ncbi:hypothetical protein [Rathayibacter sp. AY1A7]|uniref:hypothetical protein n=1 Tax=Rathayibacter sp. AY1A7 TaxID=2080524 RepID=UPI0015E2BDD0|nr:hypothetical protein [Rathayibacter sp. AY1A7]
MDELDELLARLRVDPVGTPAVDLQLDRMVDALENAQVRESLARSVSRRRWRLPTLVGVASLLVLVPVAATAVGLLNARTGTFGGSGTEVVDRSEWIGLHADGVDEALLSIYPDDLSLPDGASRTDVVGAASAVLREMGTAPQNSTETSLIQETSVKFIYENAARCLWYREWLDADERDDEDRANAAAIGITEAASWPATTASDGGGVVAGLTEEASYVSSGDRAHALWYYQRSCEGFYGPVYQ